MIKEQYDIAVAGTGYVRRSIATLLAQHFLKQRGD